MSKHTPESLLADAQDRYKGKVFAFNPALFKGKYWVPGISVLGEPGYTMPNNVDLSEDMDAVTALCDAANGLLPYDATTCSLVVFDSMQRQNFDPEAPESIEITYKDIANKFRSEDRAKEFWADNFDEIEQAAREGAMDQLSTDIEWPTDSFAHRAS